MRRQRVSEMFGISVNHVTKELRRYEEAYPNNVLYDHRRQVYIPGPSFEPRFASRDPREYLGLQLARAETGSEVVAPLLAGWDTVPTDTVPNPPHGIGEDVLPPVIRAITEGTGIEVSYFSISGGGPASRQLYPHALLHGGIRWYVRAYDPEKNEFRSFALQRMEHVKGLPLESPVAATQDTEWHQFQTLLVVPNPKLSPAQQQLVARDYGMVGSGSQAVWSVELRRCLIPYFASVYGLDRSERSPLRQRIVLQNIDEMRRWFFSAAEE